MPEIISREQAIELGLKRYFTGAPCKAGHVCERTIGHRHCLECERARKRSGRRRTPVDRAKTRLWTKRWRDNNPDKVREYQRKWVRANPEKHRAGLKRWRDKNKPRLAEQASSYQRKRQEKIGNLIAVLRKEMPDLLKEFGL